MTRSQFERAKILQMKSAIESARQAELRLLAQGRDTADPRYVQSVVEFLWTKLLERKLALRDSLPEIERKRLNTLTELAA